MKMAKASKADLDMAMELCSALDQLTGWAAQVPDEVAIKSPDAEPDDYEPFHRDDREQSVRVLGHLLELADRASLLRVVYGCAVMLDPRNQCVDPDTDTIEHHPATKAGLAAMKARPLSEWDETDRDALWWRFPIDEPPYCGHPNCSDWPGYHTHWTPLIVPKEPTA